MSSVWENRFTFLKNEECAKKKTNISTKDLCSTSENSAVDASGSTSKCTTWSHALSKYCLQKNESVKDDIIECTMPNQIAKRRKKK